MLSISQYDVKYCSNKAHLSSLIVSNGPRTWIVIVAFYTIIPLVDAYWVRLKQQQPRTARREITDHISRNLFVSGNFDSEIDDSFSELREAAYSGRYHSHEQFDKTFGADAAFNRLMNTDYPELEAKLLKLLGWKL